MIDLFPSPGVSGHIFSIYIDDGETPDYKDGKFGFVDISYSFRERDRLALTIASRDQRYPCTMGVGTLHILGLPAAPKCVSLDGVPLPQVTSADELNRQGFFYDAVIGRLALGLHVPSRHVVADIRF